MSQTPIHAFLDESKPKLPDPNNRTSPQNPNILSLCDSYKMVGNGGY